MPPSRQPEEHEFRWLFQESDFGTQKGPERAWRVPTPATMRISDLTLHRSLGGIRRKELQAWGLPDPNSSVEQQPQHRARWISDRRRPARSFLYQGGPL